MIANKAIEQMTRDEMSALQLKRLQKQVNWALEKSAYYYKVFSAAGINKDTIQSLDDIRKIPFTTPDDLEQVSAFDLLTLPISAVLRISRQGGKRTFKKIYTSGDLAYQIEMLTRVLVAHGINKSTVVGLLGESSDSRLMDVQYALENIGATVLLLGTDKENIKELITEFRIDVLISDFLQVTKLIVLLQAMGISTEKLYLPEVICMEEGVLNPNKNYIEQRLKTRNTIIYNSPSMGCAGSLFSCQEGNGFHVQEDYFYPEIVAFGSDEIITDSHTVGELVLTALAAEAMPVFRYRTGQAVMHIDKPCDCGRTLLRVATPTEYEANAGNSASY